MLQLKLMSEGIRNGVQDMNCLLGDFGTDPVARENGEVQKHAASLSEALLAARKRYTPQR